MNCPICKSKRVKAYANDDLLLVVASVPEASKLTGFFCERETCRATFYILEAIVDKGLANAAES